MSENTVVRAPYNFVPFTNHVLHRYEDAAQLPPHDVIDPALKSGEIHVTMTADTPVFVSDGKKDQRDVTHFFRGANGKYMIPGSTIRGMVRQNMQILGLAAVCPGEDMRDYQIYYREMAAARGSTGDNLKNHYKGVLDIKSLRSQTGKTYTIPQNVKAGYLCKSGNSYEIRPVLGSYLRVSRRHPDAAAFAGKRACAIPVAYTLAGERVKQLCEEKWAGPGMAKGQLLFTGKSIGKPNALYLFPEADPEQDAVELSGEDVVSYKEDWEIRKNSLNAYYDANFWALPGDGEEKPVFYVQHNGHIYFGMSLFLRIGYQNSLSQGLPKQHWESVQNGRLPLDYPRAILGYAFEKNAYRSRVSFGDFPALGTPVEEKQMDMILGQPKPSYYPGYVQDGKHYNEDDFKLRGYKQYWMKEAGAPKPEKVKVASHICPLPAGTKFNGVIRYRNLHEDELGLLLWSLVLDEGCFQSVGMGKPYGFGRMKLTVDELREYDPAALYSLSGLTSGGKSDCSAVDRYISAYDSYAAKKLKEMKVKKCTSLRDRNEIKDFMCIRSKLRENDQVSYMGLTEYKNIRTPLPSLRDVREELKQQEEQNKPQSKEDMLAALQARFNKKL